MFIKSKIQFFESKSQRTFYLLLVAVCCLSSQRYNFLKANHNSKRLYVFLKKLFIKSKIQFFESKSQLPGIKKTGKTCCLSSQRYNFLKANHNHNLAFCSCKFVVYQVKDTIFWKQITTRLSMLRCICLLFIKSKIQFFESKSQRDWDNSYNEFVVYQVKDTIFWKQITT